VRAAAPAGGAAADAGGRGGSSKTRLALQVAAELQGLYCDGVVFVALAALRDPALVASTLAQALRVQESGTQPLQEALTEALRTKQLLLVLDNFEQVARRRRWWRSWWRLVRGCRCW
jgi:predicted ATPase